MSVSASQASAGTTVTLKAMADDTRSARNGYGKEASQSIAAARCSVDGPSWSAGASVVKMRAADGGLNANEEGVLAMISSAGWATGRHLLMVESQDAGGNRGVPSCVLDHPVTRRRGVTFLDQGEAVGCPRQRKSAAE